MQSKQVYIISLVFLLIISCEKEKPEPPEPPDLTRITISNEAASQISYSTATLKATLGDTYGFTIEDYGHCWSISQNPDVTKNKTAFGSIKGGKSYTSNIENLLPGTKYLIRMKSL